MFQIKYLILLLKHEQTRTKKTKKNNKLNQTVKMNLLEGIKFHTNKNYKKLKALYNKVLLSEPTNYDALRHLGILKSRFRRL